jgi:hypothetical protein
MKRAFAKIFIIPGWRVVVCVLLTGVGCSFVNAKCPAPAESLTAQAFDLCFLQHETDDIAHPGVQACYSEWMSKLDSCETRTQLKAERCRLLLSEEQFSHPRARSACITSMETEGYFVNGCEYPFTEQCIERLHAVHDERWK